MVGYPNGYDSGEACHKAKSNKKTLNEVVFRSCRLIRKAGNYRLNFPSVPGFVVLVSAFTSRRTRSGGGRARRGRRRGHKATRTRAR
jgi:hypothetical protein